MSTCEAMTVGGARCGNAVAYVDDVEGLPRRLCGTHARAARLGALRLWHERPPVDEPAAPRRGRPWGAEEDALVEDLGVPASEVAERLGRTVAAVVLRRSLKARGLR